MIHIVINVMLEAVSIVVIGDGNGRANDIGVLQLPHGERGGGPEARGQLRHLLGAHEGGSQAALRAPLPQVSLTATYLRLTPST